MIKPDSNATDALHFARVAFGEHLPDARDLQLSDSIEREYTDRSYDKRLHGLEKIKAQELHAGWQRLAEYALRDIAHVWPVAEQQHLAEQLASDSVTEMGNGYAQLQQWCVVHAAEHPHLPMLRFIAATPPELGYMVNVFDHFGQETYDDYYVKGIVQQAKGGWLNSKLAKSTMDSLKTIPEPHATTIAERLAHHEVRLNRHEIATLQLADGALPNIAALLNRYTYKASVDGSTKRDPMHSWAAEYRAEVATILPLLEAAIGVRGQRWQTEAPEHLRVLTKHYTELQWLVANPMLGESTIPWQEDILRVVPSSIASTEDGTSRDKRLSWPLFLHKLCFAPDRLEQHWQEAKPSSEMLLIRYLESGEYDPGVLAELAGVAAAAFPEQAEGDPVDILQRVFIQDGKTTYTLARELYIKEHGDKDVPNNFPPIAAVETCLAQAKDWFWRKRIQPLKRMLEAVVLETDAPEKIKQLKPGFYRNFCLALRAEGSDTSTPELAELMAAMKAELGDGAEINRSADVVNGYVKANYFEGTLVGKEWRLQWLLDHDEITPAEADHVRALTWDDGTYPAAYKISDYVWQKRHDEAKREHKRTAESYPTSVQLMLFSDTVERTDKGESMLDPMYKPKYAAAELLPALERVASAPADIGAVRSRVLELMPEPCQFRDYFLDVLAQHELWQVLQQLCPGEQLAEANIQLEQRPINLREHFTTVGTAVVDDAYMERYPSVRVSGLVRLGELLDIPAKKHIADFLTDSARLLTAGAREIYERQAVDFEIDHLRVDYQAARAAVLGDTAEPLPAMVTAANEQAFQGVLDHVLERFPKATHHRDSILFALMTDLATTEVQCSTLERLTYRYQVNHPGDFPPGEPPTFAATETMKHYLAMFSDKGKRSEVLLWLLGGDMPDDRFLASRTFKINEQDKVAAFWALSSEERRTIFYSAMLGNGGLCEVEPFSLAKRGIQNPDERTLHNFSEDMFELVFTEALAENPPLQRIGRIVFREIMTGYSPSRRVEFLVSLLEQLREVKIKEQKLRPGEALRMVLQGLGVVGVKVGQVLSERPDLIADESIRADLGNLRDQREPFNKRGVFAYARTAKLFQARAGAVQFKSIGECVGSASIKQVHKAETTQDATVAFKVERPNTARNFAEDMIVLNNVVSALQTEGYSVPDWLAPEVEQAVLDELDFGKEAAAARDLGARVEQRGAAVQVGELTLPVRVPKVLFVRERGEGETQRIQLIVEEFFAGLSLANVERLQNLGAKGAKRTPAEEQRWQALQAALPDTAARDRYLDFDVQAAKAGAAIDWLYQVADDGIFHADPHGGNSIVDLQPGAERFGLIDAGSVGRCETAEMRQAFLEFTVRLVLLKQGLQTETEPVARIVHEYTGRSISEATWKEVVDKALRDSATTADLFKDLVGSIMRVPNSTPDKNFHYLIKALASSGGNFEALQERLQTQIIAALMSGQPEQIMQIPEFQKLFPLLIRIPGIDPSAFMPQV